MSGFQPLNKLEMLAVGLIFVLSGLIFQMYTQAATYVAPAEAESGVLGGTAGPGDVNGASNGQSVKFGAAGTAVSATKPCAGNPAPAQWKHVVVLIFENKVYNDVIGADAPFISGLASKCGTYANWKDSNTKVDGSKDGSYDSKPSYATLTSGVPPSVHGMKDDAYTKTSSVDNIFNRLYSSGKTAKVYQPGGAASCATSNFSGAYHDPLRYYTNVGAQSSSSSTLCNKNDVPIASFMTDINAGSLPDFSVVLPTNDQNMHDNSISSGDDWARDFLTPLLNSARYKSGDTAVFFLWDEEAPIPTVFMAPSIVPGAKPPTPSGNPISHFSALRTWQEMLGISPLLGDTGQAPSILNLYNGR